MFDFDSSSISCDEATATGFYHPSVLDIIKADVDGRS
jgi:hypothetical protein